MENRLPSVFVSSTMYDLSELRAALQRFIEGLGWRAVLAEHGSFAVDTAETTVQNSIRNVRENADVLVMIVGARYGHVSTKSGKSVTNLEFLEARSRGVPVYVFVDNGVLAQLPVWRDNPAADFSGVVDTPRVFEFIDSFRSDGGIWTFSFSTATEIVDTLRTQFAYLVRDALGTRQLLQGNERLAHELEGNALMLALRREEYWEPKLFGTVLEAELDRRFHLYREIEYGLARADTVYVSLAQFPNWLQTRFHELERLAETAETILNDFLPQAFATEGVDGDALEIVAAARRLAQVWEDSAQWTLRCRSIRIDAQLERIADALSQGSINMLNEIWDFGHTINARFERAIEQNIAERHEVLDLTLQITADFDRFREEMAQFQANFR